MLTLLTYFNDGCLLLLQHSKKPVVNSLTMTVYCNLLTYLLTYLLTVQRVTRPNDMTVLTGRESEWRHGQNVNMPVIDVRKNDLRECDCRSISLSFGTISALLVVYNRSETDAKLIKALFC